MKDIYRLDNLKIVVDNNVLQDLYELSCISLLFEVAEVVLIPRDIFKEALPEVKEVLLNYSYKLCDIEDRKGYDILAILYQNQKYKKLSHSDRVCVSIAGEQYMFCGSNDKPVRNACLELGIKHTGTLGILGNAFYHKIISKKQLQSIFEVLKSNQTTSYISKDLIEDYLNQILDNLE